MASQKYQELIPRLVAALEANAADALLDLMEREAVAVGALGVGLDSVGRGHLRAVLSYCRRWRVEGGPHPEQSRKQRVRTIRDDIPRLWRGDKPSFRTIVRPALYDWNHLSTQLMRGALIQVLVQIQQLDQEQPKAKVLAKATRKPAGKVMAREQDILRALPGSGQAFLKNMGELEQRLARNNSPPWDRRTLDRSIERLRLDGRVDEARLRRTAKGDRSIQE